jgi:hypothetical protein
LLAPINLIEIQQLKMMKVMLLSLWWTWRKALLAEEKSHKTTDDDPVRAVLGIEPDRRAPPESRVDVANDEKSAEFRAKQRNV